MILLLSKGLTLSGGGEGRAGTGTGTWARWPGEGRPAGAGGAGGLPLAGMAVTSQAETRKAVRQAPLEAEQTLPSCLKDCGCEWERLTARLPRVPPEAGVPQGRACVFSGPSTDTFLPSGAQATQLPLGPTLQKVHT